MGVESHAGPWAGGVRLGPVARLLCVAVCGRAAQLGPWYEQVMVGACRLVGGGRHILVKSSG